MPSFWQLVLVFADNLGINKDQSAGKAARAIDSHCHFHKAGQLAHITGKEGRNPTPILW